MIKSTTLFPQDFPTKLENTPYVTKICYEDEEEKLDLINHLAERISTIYATFLTQEGYEKRSKQLFFYQAPRTFPDQEKVEKFKDTLKSFVSTQLKHQVKNTDFLTLETDAGPMRILGKILDDCGILPDKYDLHCYFPVKLTTSICLLKQYREIRVHISGGKG